MSLRPLGEVGEELARWASSDIPRIPTGYSFFDSRTSGGIATGEQMVMLARSGVGKTWFALNVLANNPTIPTVLFSLEMHARYILQRLAGIHTNIATSIIEETLRSRGHAAAVDNTIKAYPMLRVEDEPGLTLMDMADVLEEYREATGVKPLLAVIDYMELVSTFGASAVESTDKLAKELKNFARESDVALIVLHQVNRGESVKKKGAARSFSNQGHLPLTMTDGRYAGETSADYLLGMYRPGLDPNFNQLERDMYKNNVMLQFLKTRTGGGVLPLGVQHFFDEPTGRITEIRWRNQ